MMMADRNISQPNEDNHSKTEYTDQLFDGPSTSEPVPHTSAQSDSYPKQDQHLDFSSSSLHRTRLSTRDSGYSTDLSPATVVTPSMNTPAVQQFVFHNPSPLHVQGRLDSTFSPSQDHISSHISTTRPNINAQGNTDTSQRTSTSTRLPNVVRLSSSTEVDYGHFKLSSRSVHEPFDSNQVLIDYETSNEEEVSRRRQVSSNSEWPLPSSPPARLRNDFDLSQGVCSLHLLDISFDDEDEDNEDGFTKRSSTSKNMNITNNKTVPPRFRRSSLSMRSRRYCSEEDDDDDSVLGACGGCDLRRTISGFSTDQQYHQRSRSFNEYTFAEDNAENPHTRRIRGSDTKDTSSHNMAFSSLTDPESPLSCSQGFQPGYFDCDPQDNDSDAVFYFDHDSFEAEKDNRAPQVSMGARYPVSAPGEESTPSCSSSHRQRGSSLAASLPTSSACLSTSFGSAGSVSVSTQTPHMASAMIQHILVSSQPLPNEARGTAASRLRRLSESGVPIRPSAAPLPDIIVSAGRDRSLSVPNLQELSRRRAAREFGQELRRLSDEFNCRRNLSPVHEEFDGHPASYPTMRPRYLRHTITQFGSLIMYTFRGRHNT